MWECVQQQQVCTRPWEDGGEEKKKGEKRGEIKVEKKDKYKRGEVIYTFKNQFKKRKCDKTEQLVLFQNDTVVPFHLFLMEPV